MSKKQAWVFVVAVISAIVIAVGAGAATQTFLPKTSGPTTETKTPTGFVQQWPQSDGSTGVGDATSHVGPPTANDGYPSTTTTTTATTRSATAPAPAGTKRLPKVVGPWKITLNTKTHKVAEAPNDDGTTAVIDLTASQAPPKDLPIQLASIVWGGTPKYPGGCWDLVVTYWRYNKYLWFTSTIYKAHQWVHYCALFDVIDSRSIIFNWWFDSMAPGMEPYGGIERIQYWDGYPGRNPHSSFIERGSQYIRQCLVKIGCNSIEHPWIWMELHGNSTYGFDAGR